MKLKASVFLASALISSAAFAEEMKDSKLEKKVVPYGVLQGTMTLSDTQANNTPAAALNVARFGLKVSEGIAKGQLELQFTANSETNGKNLVTVRRADVGVDLDSGTSVRLGRYRLGGAGAWGVDASGTATGFGPADGAMVAQNVDLGEGNSLKFQLGLANTLSANGSWSGIAGNTDFSSDGSKKGDRAVLASLDATVAGVALAAYYGYEGKHTSKVGDVETTKDIDEGKAYYRSMGHLEVSAGYNMDGIGAGVWYERYDLGKAKEATVVNKNIVDAKSTLAGELDSKTTSSRIGVGMNGDSTLFGVSDLVQKGDKITYGLSYVLTQVRNSVADDAEEKKNDVSQIAVGAGYNVGGFTTELDFAFETAKNEAFDNPNATIKKKNNQIVYLTSMYAF